MEETISFVTLFADYGVGWVIAAAVIGFLMYVCLRMLKVWESDRAEKNEQNRQLVKITGQMVQQMDRSTDVSEQVAHQMEVISNTNAAMVDALTHSQERSQQMGEDTKLIKDRVEFLYQRLIKGE